METRHTCAHLVAEQQSMFRRGHIIFNCDVLTIATGLAEYNGYTLDFIEAVADVEPKMPWRLLQLRPEQFVIFLRKLEHSVRGFVYRELTGRVIIVIVMMRAVRQTGNGPKPKHSCLSFVYREVTGQVTTVLVVTSRQCQVYPNTCLPNAMRGYDEGTAFLFDTFYCLRQGSNLEVECSVHGSYGRQAAHHL